MRPRPGILGDLMGRLIGYAGVNTPYLSLDLQNDKFNTAGYKTKFSYKISGVRDARPCPAELLKHLRHWTYECREIKVRFCG